MNGNEKDSLKNHLAELADKEGFSRSRVLNPLPSLIPSGHTDQPFPDGARSAFLVFLPYERGQGESVLAPFARSNYYREAVTRLKRIVSAVSRETGWSREELRLFCNSRFPEKQMAWLCGLGGLGRNSLVITPEYGSQGIIAGMFLPGELSGDTPLEENPYEGCRSCLLCVEACPGNAVKEKGGIERRLCYQFLSTRGGELPEEVLPRWNILYGCQICQDVCPRNSCKPEGHPLGRGKLGSEPDLSFILTASNDDLKALFKGTILGQSWIDPVLIRRNALICLWRESAAEERSRLTETFMNHQEAILAATARRLRDLG